MKQKRVFVLVVVILIALLGVVGLMSTTSETAAAQSRPLSTEQACSIEEEYLEELFSVGVTVTWATQVEGGWHTLHWADVPGPGWDSLTGSEYVTHTYESAGTYLISFVTDDVDTNEEKCWATAEVVFEEPTLPTGSLSTTTLPDTLVALASGEYGNADEVCLFFGDGDNYCTPGLPNPFVGVTHEYSDYGQYTLSLVMTNAVGTTTLTDTVNFVEPPSDQPAGTLTVEQLEGLAVVASGTYSNSIGSWNACLDWMDPEDPNDVCYDGKNGEFASVGHTYPFPGVYTPTLIVTGTSGIAQIPFTIDLTGNEPPPTMTEHVFLPIVMAPPAPPPTVDVTMNWQSAHEVEFIVDITGANSDWHVFYFGDGAEFGLYGNDSFVFKHTYNPGTWTATIEVSGPGGSTSWEETFVSPHTVSPPPRPD